MWVTSSTGLRTVHSEYSRHNLSRHTSHVREGDVDDVWGREHAGEMQEQGYTEEYVTLGAG
jgi:hypothetical protein